MEFFYEEEALNQNAAASQPVSQNDSKDSHAEHMRKDDKTNEAFNKFEDEVGNVYEKTTSKLKDIMSNDSSDINIQIPLMDDETAAKAQKYIKTLDSNLASIENVATSYWNKVSSSGFWSNVTQNLSSQVDDIVKIVTENSPEDDGPLKHDDDDDSKTIGGNKTKRGLRKLSTDKTIYLEYKKDSSYKEIMIKDKASEISSLLKDDKELDSLMKNIVPELISYNEFWSIYFNEKTKVPTMENEKIIAAKDSDEKETKDNETIDWGNDDEEEEDSSVVIVKKEDISSESIEKASHNETADDSDEDDWE